VLGQYYGRSATVNCGEAGQHQSSYTHLIRT
jgi:hypothetical protein